MAFTYSPDDGAPVNRRTGEDHAEAVDQTALGLMHGVGRDAGKIGGGDEALDGFGRALDRGALELLGLRAGGALRGDHLAGGHGRGDRGTGRGAGHDAQEFFAAQSHDVLNHGPPEGGLRPDVRCTVRRRSIAYEA